MNMGMGVNDIYMMGGMGLLVSVPAPAVVLLTRRATYWDRLPPAAAVGVVFVLVHAAAMVLMEQSVSLFVDVLLHVCLFVAAVAFWVPVFSTGRRRLSDAGRCVYLFLFMPTLDLVAIYLIVTGQAVGGLAMIVGMLPIGLIAVAITWGWVVREERLVRATQ